MSMLIRPSTHLTGTLSCSVSKLSRHQVQGPMPAPYGDPTYADHSHQRVEVLSRDHSSDVFPQGFRKLVIVLEMP